MPGTAGFLRDDRCKRDELSRSIAYIDRFENVCHLSSAEMRLCLARITWYSVREAVRTRGDIKIRQDDLPRRRPREGGKGGGESPRPATWTRDGLTGPHL